LQYFYDALYECTQNGLPICRPLFLTDRSDPNVYQPAQMNTQFMVGPNLLIAPVTTAGSVNRSVYLPNGSQWYAYADAQAPLLAPNAGGQSIQWYVPIDLVPIYVRAGAILPRRELEQYVGQLPQNPLTFEIYPGPDNSHTLYLDDKVGLGYQAQGAVPGKYRLTTIAQQTTLNPALTRTVSVTRTYDQFAPAEPFYFIALLAAVLPAKVLLNNAAVPNLTGASDAASAAALASSAVNGYYFSTSLQTVFVKVFDVTATAVLAATF
jgi:alpha-glucosidase